METVDPKMNEEAKPAAEGSTIANGSPLSAPVTESSMDADTSIEGTPKNSPKEKSDEKNERKPKSRKSVGTAAALNKTYIQLVQDAIVDMKDRTGSSLPAIKKWIIAKYPDLGGPHFPSRVNQAIKSGLNSKPPKLTKVRASYKIAKEFREATRLKKRKAAEEIHATKEAEQKDKQIRKEKEEFERSLKGLPPERAAALRQAKKEEDAEKAAAEADAQKMEENLRRRRFPMEDTRLHAEDKKLKIKPPASVKPRPSLPYFWQITLPFDDPNRKGKTPGTILAASKVDGLDSGSRGLVPDLLQVYHFFRGDVHFSLSPEEDDDSDLYTGIVPHFELKHLVFAVEQVLNGNARKSKQIPPLLVHLFVTCLQLLLGGHPDPCSRNEEKLYKELQQYLEPALTPASWSDVTYLYMDAMERYFQTEASRDPNVLPALPTDVHYLLGLTDTASEPLATEAPAGYGGYLGDTHGSLYRAHQKLSRSDPWLLTAEELLALLRALTEDVLALYPATLDHREEQLQELSKAKRAADANLRKMRLAYEGPQAKKAPKNRKDGEDGKTADENENGETNGIDKSFKPTATKRQFETAKKEQGKASDAYEVGIRMLVARTEPIGYDRNFNAVYCFRNDPEALYVEERRPLTGASSSTIPADLLFHRRSWHAIETSSLFDLFVSSLDTRGRRERDLRGELVGQDETEHSFRQYLIDDVREKADAKANVKKKKSLEKRLEAAKVKLENGRRSGRLAGQAEGELTEILAELEELEKSLKVEEAPEARDFEQLTGLDALREFERGGRLQTRRALGKKSAAMSRKLPLPNCSKLSSTGNIDGTGLVGLMVSSMLELEEHCESLAPWERGDTTRSYWITQLESAVLSWNGIISNIVQSPKPSLSRADEAPDSLSSPTDVEQSDTPPSHKRESLGSDVGSVAKRRKPDSQVSTTSSHSVSTILPLLKQPLLDLEDRVADITNTALATRDADMADDNMSTNSSEDQPQKEQLERAWKKSVHKLRQTPAKKYSHVRELVVSAIGAARKAHLPHVVAQLRAALLQYQPYAAGECKKAAIQVLEAHGDYEVDDDDDSLDDEKEEPEEEVAPSVLSAEAAILRSSLNGSEDARREDWISAVRNAKTISRLASLSAAFVSDAMGKIVKLEFERAELTKAINRWNKADERPTRKRDNKTKNSNTEATTTCASEVWANVHVLDEICMVKAEDYPWWPAKKCVAKDPDIAESLHELNRCLVAFVGEMGGIRVVKTEEVKPFEGNTVDEDIEYSKDLRMQLDECMTMARRILRGIQGKKAASPSL